MIWYIEFIRHTPFIWKVFDIKQNVLPVGIVMVHSGPPHCSCLRHQDTVVAFPKPQPLWHGSTNRMYKQNKFQLCVVWYLECNYLCNSRFVPVVKEYKGHKCIWSQWECLLKICVLQIRVQLFIFMFLQLVLQYVCVCYSWPVVMCEWPITTSVTVI